MEKSKPERPAPDSFGTGPFDELVDMEGELFEAGVWSSLDDVGKKEGLPAQYAMRHDAHYVDEVVSAEPVRQVIRVPVKRIAETPCDASNIEPLADSIAELGVLEPLLVRRRGGRYEIIAGARRLAAAKAAGLTEVPCLLHDIDDPRVERVRAATNLHGGGRDPHSRDDDLAQLKYVFPLLGKSLQTLLSCLRMLNRSGSLSNQVASDLIHTEAERAARLVWGATLIGFTPNLVLGEFDGADVFEDVLSAYDSEHPLAGLRLVTSIHRPCNLRADRRLVSVAMRGAVDTILPLVRSHRDATVAVRLARHEPSRTVVLQVSQNAIRPPDSVWCRWFDLGWRERPGGIASGVGLLAAKRVTELHGGRIAIAPNQERGCQLTLCLPEAAST